jgi:hypothetical protein
MAVVAALRKEGEEDRRMVEEDRRRVAEVETQLQSTQAQLMGMMETIGQMANELKEQQRSTREWQETATQQMREMSNTLQAQTEMFMTELRAMRHYADAVKGSSISPQAKKRSRQSPQQSPTTAKGNKQGLHSTEALEDGEEEDLDMEEGADGKLHTSQLPVALTRGGALGSAADAQGAEMTELSRTGRSDPHQQDVPLQGHVLGSPHPQPHSMVEGGGH